jgi:hypothetical protein
VVGRPRALARAGELRQVLAWQPPAMRFGNARLCNLRPRSPAAPARRPSAMAGTERVGKQLQQCGRDRPGRGPTRRTPARAGVGVVDTLQTYL